MNCSRIPLAVLMLAGVPAHAMTIDAPDRAEIGAAVPVEIKPAKPLSVGHRLDLLVNGELATQVKVINGRLTGFSTRIKSTRSNTTIEARVMANGRLLDSGSLNIQIGLTAPASGPPTSAGTVKIRNRGGGDVVMLLPSVNGFTGTLVVRGAGFQVEITGGSTLAQNPIIGVRGDFSGPVTASINGQTKQASADPREDNAVAARAREESRQQKWRAHQAVMEKLRADQAAQQASAEQERKEARRRDMREALGVLKTYADTSTSMGNNKPANQLSRLETVIQKPADSETRVSAALNTYADRLNRKGANNTGSNPGIGANAPQASVTRDGHNWENSATQCIEISSSETTHSITRKKVPMYKYINNCPYDLSVVIIPNGNWNLAKSFPTGGRSPGRSYGWAPFYWRQDESPAIFACRGSVVMNSSARTLGCRR